MDAVLLPLRICSWSIGALRHYSILDAVLADKGLKSHPIVRFLGERGLIPCWLLSRLINRFEGGAMYSRTWRHVLAHKHGVIAGAYSYGSLLTPGHGGMGKGLVVGRYVSIAGGVQWPTEHPISSVSMHPLLYKEPMPPKLLHIDHGAWIGVNAIITSKCRRIGIGAVVGAGSVVTRDVPDFAVVAGVPAKILRYRFPAEEQQRIVSSKWWDKNPEELRHTIIG